MFAITPSLFMMTTPSPELLATCEATQFIIDGTHDLPPQLVDSKSISNHVIGLVETMRNDNRGRR